MALYIAVGIILLAFEYAYFILAKRLRIVDRPHHQSSHIGVVVRGGGIVFYVAFMLWLLNSSFTHITAVMGFTLIATVSFIDDIKGVNPKIRLVCQFVAIFLMFDHSGLIHNSIHVVLILAIACVAAINIYNFMDGINGMTGGYSMVVTLALYYVNQNIVQFFDEHIFLYLILALLVFNVFNFRKQAKCFAGDVGSLSIGFIMVYLILRLSLKGHSMSWIAMLSVYLVDGGMTILHRLLLHENLLKPHKKHAYQIMANELEMPHLIVSIVYMGLQTVCCTIYIIWPGYPAFFVIFGTLIAMYLVFMKKYYHLHVQNH